MDAWTATKPPRCGRARQSSSSDLGLLDHIHSAQAEERGGCEEVAIVGMDFGEAVLGGGREVEGVGGAEVGGGGGRW